MAIGQIASIHGDERRSMTICWFCWERPALACLNPRATLKFWCFLKKLIAAKLHDGALQKPGKLQKSW